MATRRVSEQVEKLIDESPVDQINVIVKMASDDAQMGPIMGAAAKASKRRNLALTARDILPISYSELNNLRSGERSESVQRRLTYSGTNVSEQIAAAQIASVSTDILMGSGRSRLEPLIKSNIVQVTLGRMAESTGTQLKSEPGFWMSNSLALEISRDDLANLPEEVPEIQGIFPNRRLSLPPVVEVLSLPANVVDNKTSSWGVDAIGALSAWGAYGARGKGVKVGILDTGIDATHPDLTGKVAGWAEFDGMGNRVAVSTPHDSGEHGTHTAGTIVGGNASGQWIGIAPEAELFAALVLDGENGGTDAQVQAGMEWAVEQGVDVISLSLGGPWFGPEAPDFYTEAIISALRLGIPVVIAIGNSGSQTTGSPGNDILAFSVGATDYEDRPAGFSGGRTHVIQSSEIFSPDALPLIYSKPEISAPGVAVKSSTPGSNWKVFNGTSMATPHAAGAIALLLSATGIRGLVAPLERAFLIQEILIGSVEELGESGQDHRYGFGRLDVLRAIGYAKELGY